MQEEIKNKTDELKKLCSIFRVKRLYIFGSATNNNFNADSDVDLLISFEDDLSVEEYTNNFFALHEKLSSLFVRSIDLVTERTLSNPYFIESVNKTKQLIYEA